MDTAKKCLEFTLTEKQDKLEKFKRWVSSANVSKDSIEECAPLHDKLAAHGV